MFDEDVETALGCLRLADDGLLGLFEVVQLVPRHRDGNEHEACPIEGSVTHSRYQWGQAQIGYELRIGE